MDTPRWLLGAALIFWGFFTEAPVVALALALLMEGRAGIGWRWEFQDKDFRRIWRISFLLVIGTGVYAYISTDPGQSVSILLRWLPVLFLPIAAAQAYATRDRIPLSVFSLLSQFHEEERRRVGRPPAPPTLVNVSYPYLLLTLISAGSANPDGYSRIAFYVGICFLGAWALRGQASRAVPPQAWCALLLVAALGGAATHTGIYALQKWIEKRVDLFSIWDMDADPYRSQTRLGAVEELKLSGQILYILRPVSGVAPTLLRESSYQRYADSAWSNRRGSQKFAPLEAPPGHERNAWSLLPASSKTVRAPRSFELTGSFPGNQIMLPLPPGAVDLRNLPAIQVERSTLGALRVIGGPRAFSPLVRYDPLEAIGDTGTAGPQPDDLEIPPGEQAALEEVARNLGLPGKSRDEILHTVRRFFLDNFTYTLRLSIKDGAPSGSSTALAQFLTSTRSGHCEYFATATTLLLRAAGLPARYTTGYAVQEQDASGCYIIRSLHSHAWATVWDESKGVWRDFDTTPPSWLDSDARPFANMIQWCRDALASLQRNFLLWQSSPSYEEFRKIAPWFLFALLAGILLRVLLGGDSTVARKRLERQRAALATLGPDADFALLEQGLARLGGEREPAETHIRWWRRLLPALPPAAAALPFPDLLARHHRHRFDPLGLPPDEIQSHRAACRRAAESLP